MPTQKMIKFVQQLRLKGININFTKPRSEIILSISQNKKLEAPKV